MRTTVGGVLLLGLATPVAAQERVLDAFDDVSAWEAAPSDGVSLSISPDQGFEGRAMRLDFDFHGGAGYAIARRPLPVDLPENYRFTFRIRAEAPLNNFEFKLIDPSGENVWWVNRKGFEFPVEWRKLTVRKRHLEFAWGPKGGGDMERARALELAITAGTGGSGTVWIDELAFEPLPPEEPYDRTPTVRASSSAAGHGPERALDGVPATGWRGEGTGSASLTIDFLEPREYGGVVVDWAEGRHAADYRIEISDDGERWETIRVVASGNGGRDWIYLPETESRYLRLGLGGVPEAPETRTGFEIREIEIQPLAFAESPNVFFQAIAAGAPRGFYPRYFSGEQSYWTVVGTEDDETEALFSEEGVLEVGKAAFSIEPFVYVAGSDAVSDTDGPTQRGRLLTWADGTHEQSLAEDYLPIPSVTRTHGDLTLEISTFATDGFPATLISASETSTIFVTYRMTNRGASPLRARLYLAVQPFQVNPPWQFLGPPGGATEVRRIDWDGRRASVKRGKELPSVEIVPLSPPDGFGAASFDAGGIMEYLRKGALPEVDTVVDPFGYASAAFAYDVNLVPGASRTVHLGIPLHASAPQPPVGSHPEDATAFVEVEREKTARAWQAALRKIEVDLPDSAEEIVETLYSNVAYILINKDGPAIQPGSRSYDRSWIRDGALTSTALLRTGHSEEVRDFIEWYAAYQFPSGKVPCCVDDRGADPVPENDSHGEFIYLVAEYCRFTGDTVLVTDVWPHVTAAVAYIDSLRQRRRTAEYRTPEKRAFFGLVPESISHEGYSAKPMHSYWDDFWALEGLQSAAEMARVLGQRDRFETFSALRNEFARDLYASLERAIAMHGIAFIPGSVELGDFDPTSTTIALAPVGELANLPEPELMQTFERYWEEHRRRRDREDWEAYTPYELRSVGAFLRLGWKARAHELLGWIMEHRRPAEWNQWAEVVWRNPEAPKFIGDMPHTWVGSDYIRSVLDFFAYEREADGALVLGAGVTPEWAREGFEIRNLRTPYGSLDLTVSAMPGGARVQIGGEMRVPPGGFAVQVGSGEKIVWTFPAVVNVEYR